MFRYESNKQVKNEFKKITIDCNATMVSVANKCDITPQQLNNRFNNARLALTDLQTWCDALGYDLYIDFVKRD